VKENLGKEKIREVKEKFANGAVYFHRKTSLFKVQLLL